MKNQLYIVFDKVTEEDWPILETRNDQAAFRAAIQRIMGINGSLDDYTLTLIGTIESGNIELLPHKHLKWSDYRGTMTQTT